MFAGSRGQSEGVSAGNQVGSNYFSLMGTPIQQQVTDTPALLPLSPFFSAWPLTMGLHWTEKGVRGRHTVRNIISSSKGMLPVSRLLLSLSCSPGSAPGTPRPQYPFYTGNKLRGPCCLRGTQLRHMPPNYWNLTLAAPHAKKASGTAQALPLPLSEHDKQSRQLRTCGAPAVSL